MGFPSDWVDGRQEGGAQVAVQAGHPEGGAQVDFLKFMLALSF